MIFTILDVCDKDIRHGCDDVLVAMILSIHLLPSRVGSIDDQVLGESLVEVVRGALHRQMDEVDTAKWVMSPIESEGFGSWLRSFRRRRRRGGRR